LRKAAADAGDWIQRWRVPAICLALAAIILAVFGQTAGFGFVNYDDNDYVYDNTVVAKGLTFKGVAWVFTHTDCGLYHPLTMLSLMGDYQLHGLQAGGYHFINVLLHTASVLLLFLILRQMTGALWRSAFVAAVFAIHPLRVESVAWVAERKDVLSAFFFMLTLGAYVRYVRKPDSLGRYLMVVVAFVLALLSKPTVVTLPFVLLLLDYWPLRRFEQPGKLSRLILEKIPLVALSAGACVTTVLAARKWAFPNDHFSVPWRLSNALVSCGIYLRQMVWPEGLAVPYPTPHGSLPPWEVAVAGALLAGLSAVAWRERRTRPWLLAGWLWYLGMLTPMIGIVQVGSFTHADRYTYLPQIGIYLALTWLVAGWRLSRAAFGGLMAVVLAMLMVCAWIQTTHWQDSEALWTHTLECTKGNVVAHFDLGVALDQEKMGDEAIAHFQKAQQIKPDYANACYGLGIALSQKGKVDEAIAQFQEALQIRPDYLEAHYNLGLALRQKGKVDEAIAQYQKALKINPDHPGAHNSLGGELLQEGKVDEAIAHFQKALQIKPDYASAHTNLGNAFLQKGNMSDTIAHYQEALEIEPLNRDIQNDLAWLLATCPDASLRNGNKAVELATRADELADGENPVILHTLAAAFAEAGRYPEAVETAQRALSLAGAQSNTKLAGQLQSEMKLYDAGKPLHSPAQTH
jgi:tetratricopeptide (TPR) repeat protein